MTTDGKLILYGRNEERAFDQFFAAALSGVLTKTSEERLKRADIHWIPLAAFDLAQEALLMRRHATIRADREIR